MSARRPARLALGFGAAFVTALGACGRSAPEAPNVRAAETASMSEDPAAAPEAPSASAVVEALELARRAAVEAALPAELRGRLGPRAARAFVQAQRAGRPLLVVVAPDDFAGRVRRSRAAAPILTGALGADARTFLAIAELAALPRRELGAWVADGAPLPFAVLVETDGLPPGSRTVDWPTDLDRDGLRFAVDLRTAAFDPYAAAEDQALGTLARALDAVVVGDAAMRARRAAQLREGPAYLDGEARRELPAIRLEFAAPDELEDLRRTLGTEAGERLATAPPEGFAWRTDLGPGWDPAAFPRWCGTPSGRPGSRRPAVVDAEAEGEARVLVLEDPAPGAMPERVDPVR